MAMLTKIHPESEAFFTSLSENNGLSPNSLMIADRISGITAQFLGVWAASSFLQFAFSSGCSEVEKNLAHCSSILNDIDCPIFAAQAGICSIGNGIGAIGASTIAITTVLATETAALLNGHWFHLL